MFRSIQSRVEDIDIDETTIPDAFQNVPKVISPRVHRWLDIGVTGYFLALGAWFLSRGKGGPATAALVNAGMVAGVSALTDYEGSGEKPESTEASAGGTLKQLSVCQSWFARARSASL